MKNLGPFIFLSFLVVSCTTGHVANNYINKNCTIEQTESSKEVQQ